MSNNGFLPKVRKLYNAFYVQNRICSQQCTVIKCWKWDLSLIINKESRTDAKYAVLVLNRTILQHPDFIKGFWNSASVRVAVDGGTSHWDAFISKLSAHEQENMKLPDLITGDFDSVKEDILLKYKTKGCKVKLAQLTTSVIHTPNQDHTDFTKALMELDKFCKQRKMDLNHVVAIAQNSGRIDQILGNIQTLHLVKDKRLVSPNTRVYIMSDDSISWLLWPGDHVITIPEETRTQKKAWCSLVPVGETCTNVTTSGLKWNLDNQPLKFGALVSTSNTFDGSEQVKIKCSHALLWSMKLPNLIAYGADRYDRVRGSECRIAAKSRSD